MRYVDSPNDLAKLARAAQVDATGTYGVVKLFGRTGINRIAKDGSNIGALVTAIKVGSRATKLTRKATSSVPTPGLLIWLLVSLLVFYLAVRPRRRDRSRRSLTPPEPQRRREPTLNPVVDAATDSAPSLPERRPEPSLSASELPLR